MRFSTTISFVALVAVVPALHAQISDDALGPGDANQYGLAHYALDERCMAAVLERCAILPLAELARPSLKGMPRAQALRAAPLIRDFKEVSGSCQSPPSQQVSVADNGDIAFAPLSVVSGAVAVLPNPEPGGNGCFSGLGGNLGIKMDWGMIKTKRYAQCRVMSQALAFEMGCVRNRDLRPDQLKTTLTQDMRTLLNQFCKTYAPDPKKCDDILPK